MIWVIIHLLTRYNQVTFLDKDFPSESRALFRKHAKSIVPFQFKQSSLVVIYCLMICKPLFENYLLICVTIVLYLS